jgi:glutathione S-transferase
MDFYHTPTSCSQATHILLHEAELGYRPHKVDIFNHTLEDGSDYSQINPNGYVPALVLNDGMLLSENVAILDWIAGQSTALLPEGEMGRTRHLQMLAFISTEIHKTFIPLFFIEDEKEQTRIRESLAPH